MRWRLERKGSPSVLFGVDRVCDVLDMQRCVTGTDCSDVWLHSDALFACLRVVELEEKGHRNLSFSLNKG